MSSDDIDTTGPAAAPDIAATRTGTARGLTRFMPGGCGLGIALPGRPVEYPVPLPAEAQGSFEQLKCYIYTEDGMAVVTTFFELSTAVPASIFAKGFFAGLAGTPQLSDFRYSLSDESADRCGVVGSFTTGDVAFEMKGFVQAKGRRVWVVWSQQLKGDAAKAARGERILKTASFSSPDCGD